MISHHQDEEITGLNNKQSIKNTHNSIQPIPEEEKDPDEYLTIGDINITSEMNASNRETEIEQTENEGTNIRTSERYNLRPIGSDKRQTCCKTLSCRIIYYQSQSQCAWCLPTSSEQMWGRVINYRRNPWSFWDCNWSWYYLTHGCEMSDPSMTCVSQAIDTSNMIIIDIFLSWMTTPMKKQDF